jgi:hypothetical protein
LISFKREFLTDRANAGASPFAWKAYGSPF